MTAACSGAALLGAPLGHDFAVISLSDLLTPWETIEKRLAAAAAADFCICLYNPASKKRGDYLRKACEILLRHRAPENAAGLVRNIGPRGRILRGDDPVGTERRGGGYVHHRVYRQFSYKDSGRQAGDAARLQSDRKLSEANASRRELWRIFLVLRGLRRDEG